LSVGSVSPPLDSSGIWYGNDAAGNGAGVLSIGSPTQTTAVRVGSRLGQVVAAGHAVHILGGSAANAGSQLGYRPTAANQGATSDLFLHAKAGGLLLQAGSAQNAYAQ